MLIAMHRASSACFGSSFRAGRKCARVGARHGPPWRSAAVGVVVDMEERPASNSGSDYRVRARFRDFITPWIGAWQLERVS
jgi:hypothetical protein